ncbi:MAG: RluA family pseudouridine synthase [Oscillospiraceae bacterium]|nr:RluA family pseudouridine synthase [Oscillospiraceae bacterium]
MTDTYTIKAKESGERIDALLAQEIDDLTRSQAARLIEEGKVTLNCASIRKNHRVAAGEVFVVEIPEAEDTEIEAENIPLDIAYEDDDLIVVNKPRGMVVHPAPGHTTGTLVNALLWHCGDSLSGIGGEKRPGIVHRIDMDTSGLLIAAKNDYAHRFLSAQLVDHSLSRTYEAVVIGRIRDDKGTIDAPIGRHHSDRKRMAVTDRNSRSAVTHYEVIARYNGYTHIRCFLETGRTHQIRVHMAYIGHPLLGDEVYGRKGREKGIEGQCLHARTLRFIHPRTNKSREVTSELPPYFTEVLSRLGEKTG